jgi:hypothetical protein
MVDFPVSDAEYLAATVHPTLEIGLEELLKHQFPKQTIVLKQDGGESVEPPIRWLAKWLKQHNSANTSQRQQQSWNQALQTIQKDENDIPSCCRNLVNGVRECFWPIQVSVFRSLPSTASSSPCVCAGICGNIRNRYGNSISRTTYKDTRRGGAGGAQRTARGGGARRPADPHRRGRHSPIRCLLPPR